MNDGGLAKDMTLRQHIACEAMKAHMIDFMNAAGDTEFTDEVKSKIRKCMREDAFAMADEMLREEPATEGETGNE